MKLALNISGIIAIPCALRRTSLGIPVFGFRVISLRTSSERMTVVSGLFWARAGGTSETGIRSESPNVNQYLDVLTVNGLLSRRGEWSPTTLGGIDAGGILTGL
jgi:hypothetical protein